MSGPRHFVIGEDEDGQRADFALAALAGISRSQARRWLDAERARTGDASLRPAQRVHRGETLAVTPPELEPSQLSAEPIDLAILFEDADLVVVDKPAGLVVHPAPGHPGGTLVNALLHHCGDLAGVGGVLRPGIVHRLDRGTSGAMVVAKTDDAHHALAAQFHDHSIEREYRALVRGVPGRDEGRVDRPIGRHPRDRKRMSVHTRRAREARTAWRVIARYPRSERTLLSVHPETGRTHQIRVHLAAAGLPIASDPVYGRGRRDPHLDRPGLHAAVLGFTHPRSGERLRFEAPLAEDFRAAVAALERREGPV